MKISRKMFCTVEFSHMCSKINIKFRRVMGGRFMKYLRQFVIILGVSFLGEILRVILPLPVPASVYGLICMLLLLKSGILKIGQVKEVSKFLIEIMPVMFVPAAVGLIESWNSLREVLIPVAIIITVTTVFVMAVTGKVTQAMMNRKKKGEQYAGDYK